MPSDEDDWEITEQGLYIATRGFLLRRGYCCANQCRNCPYINWRNQPTWQPALRKYARRMRVSPKAVATARVLLHDHEQQIQECTEEKRPVHQAMIEHYRFLLEQWESQK